MNYKELPPVEVLWTLFEYAPLTGKLYWRISPNNQIKAGEEAGSHREYSIITINGGVYKMHRVIYKLMTGRDPGQNNVDHTDRNQLNNRWWNLRLDTEGRNNQNKSVSRNNSSGVPGVSWNRHKDRWQSNITYKYKTILLGRFTDFNEAVKARKDAEKKYFGEWAPN